MQDDLDKIIEKAMVTEGIPEHLVPMVSRTLVLLFEDGTQIELTDHDEIIDAVNLMASGQDMEGLLTYRLIVEFTEVKLLVKSYTDSLLARFA